MLRHVAQHPLLYEQKKRSTELRVVEQNKIRIMLFRNQIRSHIQFPREAKSRESKMNIVKVSNNITH